MNKKILLSMAILLSSTMINGCASSNRAGTGFLVDNVTQPIENSVSSKFEFKKDDFQILGQATAEASSHNIMFLVSWGDNGYESLKTNAKKEFPYMDDIINIRVDSENLGVLFFYQRVKLKLTGTVIQYK